ncbi:NAD(P)-dependent dehydrogenase (short-subunit alcohol dehydrogenase family) [Streptomyces zagrosensis]|uniref:NAD(P)-dependent dehydrogenase (Short-subunit alcohol dehydrogenase family) n=1 Tax=Streptomyces zagrosensis TaxID=1042984 RepID=A0A7W9V2U4_9ACTN|nr:NAD(P)-dependent dehydrogenase (short-subunit alcohol dehydrogenase family) [Streptomyces zagrosensis]
MLINDGARYLEGTDLWDADADADAITDTIAAGATGTLLTGKHNLPLLRASVGADVVNVVSSAAKARNHRSQAHPAFYAAKAAQAGFADVLSHRLRPEGIRVISRYPPGFADGDPLHSTGDHASRTQDGSLTAQSVRGCVLFAIGQPRDCFIRSFYFEQM